MHTDCCEDALAAPLHRRLVALRHIMQGVHVPYICGGLPPRLESNRCDWTALSDSGVFCVVNQMFCHFYDQQMVSPCSCTRGLLWPGCTMSRRGGEGGSTRVRENVKS